MRTVGGVILLVVGISSLLSGGCALLGGSADRDRDGVRAALGQALEADGRALDGEVREQLARPQPSGAALLAAGSIILLAGALSLVGAILLLLGRVRWFVAVAAALGIAGEVVYWFGVAFYWPGLVKVGLYAIAILIAFTAVPRRGQPARPAPGPAGVEAR